MFTLTEKINDVAGFTTDSDSMTGLSIFITIVFLLIPFIMITRMSFKAFNSGVENLIFVTYEDKYRKYSAERNIAALSVFVAIPSVLILWRLIYLLLPYMPLIELILWSATFIFVLSVAVLSILSLHRRVMGFKWKDNHSKIFIVLTGLFLVTLFSTPVYLLHVTENIETSETRVNEYSLVNKNGVVDASEGWLQYGENSAGKVTVNFLYSNKNDETIKIETLDSLVTVNHSSDNVNTVTVTKECIERIYVNNGFSYEDCTVPEYELFLTK